MREEADNCGLILAAAGSGSRFGAEIPKQFASLDGKPVFLRALEPFYAFASEIVVVVPEEWTTEVAEAIAGIDAEARIVVQQGGDHRQRSVRLGLLRLGPDIEWVLVHDAARPFVSSGLIRKVLELARRTEAAIPAVPVHDTVKEVESETVVGTVDRSRLRLAQTPQAFRRSLLERAFAAAESDGFLGTDESSLVERLGEPVGVVEGELANIKITQRADLRARS
jgi:2-C-methyl-D-erythritol 4-phosphate cytidylyltransferase